jgi:hypothetical protein
MAILSGSATGGGVSVGCGASVGLSVGFGRGVGVGVAAGAQAPSSTLIASSTPTKVLNLDFISVSSSSNLVRTVLLAATAMVSRKAGGYPE